MLGAEKPPPWPSRAGEPDYRGGVTRTDGRTSRTHRGTRGTKAGPTLRAAVQRFAGHSMQCANVQVTTLHPHGRQVSLPTRPISAASPIPSSRRVRVPSVSGLDTSLPSLGVLRGEGAKGDSTGHVTKRVR